MTARPSPDRGSLQAEVSLEIPFHDVDSMNIAWHGHYLKYFEIARTALMRKADMDIPNMVPTGCGWPVVQCEVKYIRPLRYGQRVTVRATLVEFEQRIVIAYDIRDEMSQERLTKGRTTQLAVDMATGQLQFETPRLVAEAFRRAMA